MHSASSAQGSGEVSEGQRSRRTAACVLDDAGIDGCSRLRELLATSEGV
jgi:hypothetical protein